MTDPRPSALVLVVFLGGCVGGLARYEVSVGWPTPSTGFPWATLVINCSGAFLLALLLVVLDARARPSPYVRALLGTGLLGAWTTFSAIMGATFELVRHGHVVAGVGYVLASALGGLGAVLLGLRAGRPLHPRVR